MWWNAKWSKKRDYVGGGGRGERLSQSSGTQHATYFPGFNAQQKHASRAQPARAAHDAEEKQKTHNSSRTHTLCEEGRRRARRKRQNKKETK